MRFDLKTGATKCITEDIKINAMTVGKYSVVKPVEGFSLPELDRVTVRVTSPLGNNYHYADRREFGNFAFTAGEAGDYMACFWASKQTPEKTISIDFEWKSGLAAKDWSKVAKKSQVEMMELELKKLYDSVTTVHEEMYNLREREETMQHLIRSTNSKMATFSCAFFSLQVLEHLDLTFCAFEVPLMFNGFRMLKSLRFNNVEITAKKLQRFLTGCPLLEEFTLIGAQN